MSSEEKPAPLEVALAVVVLPELYRRSPLSKSRLFEEEKLLNGRVIVAPMIDKGAEAAALNC